MTGPEMVIAALPETQLTVAGLLGWLRTQGRLGPIVREALVAQLVRQQATMAGLSATAEELQAAANSFRRLHGLHSAADTRAWLAAHALSEEDFEAAREQEVLIAKLRSHLTAAAVDGQFAADPAGFERLRAAQLVVGREDLARELASQVRDEDRELDDVARDEGLQVARVAGFRKELTGPLASALASARAGELVGPVGTAHGFALVLLEERRPAELDPATRHYIQDELFSSWLTSRLREAKINLPRLGAS